MLNLKPLHHTPLRPLDIRKLCRIILTAGKDSAAAGHRIKRLLCGFSLPKKLPIVSEAMLQFGHEVF